MRQHNSSGAKGHYCKTTFSKKGVHSDWLKNLRTAKKYKTFREDYIEKPNKSTKERAGIEPEYLGRKVTKVLNQENLVNAWDENYRKAVWGKTSCTVWRGVQVVVNLQPESTLLFQMRNTCIREIPLFSVFSGLMVNFAILHRIWELND